MRGPTQRIVRKGKRGESITAVRWNQLVDPINDSLRAATGSRQTSPVKSARPTHQRFRVKSVGIDVLICREWDGTTEGAIDVNVALPYLLQRTPFDGQTRSGVTYTYTNNFTRTASDGVDSETQKITPDFVADDEIVALAVSNVVGSFNEVTSDWIDANFDGRSWAAEATA